MKIPERLFKYCPPERIDVLRNGRIRFTQATHLNDPFEINSRPDYAGYSPENIARLKQLAEHEGEIIGRHWGILSLTENSCSLPMWAFYASGHTGFLIEFDTTHQFFNPQDRPDEFFGPLKVEYGAEPPNVQRSDLRAFLHKGNDWAPEKEWRMFNTTDDAPDKWGDIFLYNLPPSSVKSIYLGCRVSEDMQKDWIRFLESDPRYKHVKIYSSVMVRETHSIDHYQIGGPKEPKPSNVKGPWKEVAG